MTLKKPAKSKTAKSADTSTPATPDTPRFPIVGIGASAGVVFVQELTSAKFDGMPRSAIDAGLADIVAPAEELTTSKEEMQSMNEELQTVNYELTAKVDELSRASNDMENLLNSTDIATLFLDNQLKVRRFTTQLTSIIKLIPGDAGRPITDLATVLDYPELVDDTREVLRSMIFQERQVSTSDGRWFTVRIMPYRTQDNRIDGVVTTFVDISVAKKLEETLREAQGKKQGDCDE